ncbi:hypothetical protein G4G28_17705 [Massilia sp. Dwa41.01b]|uniref:hypothetical protein n=1 Tax=unclassified Massilia TaxID=2609279 RepID=UPI0016047473|nr:MULTISPECIES: hypothetical protein [unclassified Massilia]QNA89867.1 hypothetical protein G4G28_17705 [Massilia sp. Dwa41.01b]QNB00755.1 hypothetical protein G4G31_21265 [Massilia sp. Se16.2.3]
MNSPILHTIQLGAPDALYDDIEHALLDLTTASLDDGALTGAIVDEFEIDFLIGGSPPPGSGYSC